MPSKQIHHIRLSRANAELLAARLQADAKAGAFVELQQSLLEALKFVQKRQSLNSSIIIEID